MNIFLKEYTFSRECPCTWREICTAVRTGCEHVSKRNTFSRECPCTLREIYTAVRAECEYIY